MGECAVRQALSTTTRGGLGKDVPHSVRGPGIVEVGHFRVHVDLGWLVRVATAVPDEVEDVRPEVLQRGLDVLCGRIEQRPEQHVGVVPVRLPLDEHEFLPGPDVLVVGAVPEHDEHPERMLGRRQVAGGEVGRGLRVPRHQRVFAAVKMSWPSRRSSSHG